MQSASVGFHCPECVAAGGRGVRLPRTSLGGRVAADSSRVTMVLVGINVLVFLVGLGIPRLDLRFGNVALALGPDLTQLVGVAAGQYYRLLTAAFLHAGIFHVLFNMFALCPRRCCGRPAASRSPPPASARLMMVPGGWVTNSWRLKSGPPLRPWAK